MEIIANMLRPLERMNILKLTTLTSIQEVSLVVEKRSRRPSIV
jgi:hypothetical protein